MRDRVHANAAPTAVTVLFWAPLAPAFMLPNTCTFLRNTDKRGPLWLLCCRLSGCLLTDEACASLASVLSAKHPRLRMLDLSYNHLGEAGAKLLSARLAGPLLNQDNLR